jgi:hypothetical protein
MDSVTHGSVSVLIGFVFIQFYSDVPLWLLLLVMFVFGVLVDYADQGLFQNSRR